MSADEEAGEAVEEAPVEEPASRIAGAVVLLVLAAVAVLLVRVVVTRWPYVAYFVAGVMACAVWHRAVAWRAGRRAVEEPEEAEPEDVSEALRDLSAGGHHVLLTTLQKRLGVADTKAVRRLLKAEKVRVRGGVRAPTGNGPGVHRDDIPPAAPPREEGHGDGCCCSSGANNANANNSAGDPSQKGLSVEAIGAAGRLVRDPSETHERRTDLSAKGGE